MNFLEILLPIVVVIFFYFYHVVFLFHSSIIVFPIYCSTRHRKFHFQKFFQVISSRSKWTASNYNQWELNRKQPRVNYWLSPLRQTDGTQAIPLLVIISVQFLHANKIHLMPQHFSSVQIDIPIMTDLRQWLTHPRPIRILAREFNKCARWMRLYFFLISKLPKFLVISFDAWYIIISCKNILFSINWKKNSYFPTNFVWEITKFDWVN